MLLNFWGRLGMGGWLADGLDHFDNNVKNKLLLAIEKGKRPGLSDREIKVSSRDKYVRTVQGSE